MTGSVTAFEQKMTNFLEILPPEDNRSLTAEAERARLYPDLIAFFDWRTTMIRNGKGNEFVWSAESKENLAFAKRMTSLAKLLAYQGVLHESKNAIESSLACYREALEICEGLWEQAASKDSKEKFAALYHLSMALNRFASALVRASVAEGLVRKKDKAPLYYLARVEDLWQTHANLIPPPDGMIAFFQYVECYSFLLENQARILKQTGHLDAALETAQACLTLREKSHAPAMMRHIAAGHSLLGECFIAQGDHEQALTAFKQARACFMQAHPHGSSPDIAYCNEQIARVYETSSPPDWENVAEYYGAAAQGLIPYKELSDSAKELQIKELVAKGYLLIKKLEQASLMDTKQEAKLVTTVKSFLSKVTLFFPNANQSDIKACERRALFRAPMTALWDALTASSFFSYFKAQDRTLQTSQKMPSWRNVACFLNCLGETHYRVGNFELAADYYLQAKEILKWLYAEAILLPATDSDRDLIKQEVLFTYIESFYRYAQALSEKGNVDSDARKTLAAERNVLWEALQLYARVIPVDSDLAKDIVKLQVWLHQDPMWFSSGLVGLHFYYHKTTVELSLGKEKRKEIVFSILNHQEEKPLEARKVIQWCRDYADQTGNLGVRIETMMIAGRYYLESCRALKVEREVKEELKEKIEEKIEEEIERTVRYFGGVLQLLKIISINGEHVEHRLRKGIVHYCLGQAYECSQFPTRKVTAQRAFSEALALFKQTLAAGHFLIERCEQALKRVTSPRNLSEKVLSEKRASYTPVASASSSPVTEPGDSSDSEESEPEAEPHQNDFLPSKKNEAGRRQSMHEGRPLLEPKKKERRWLRLLRCGA